MNPATIHLLKELDRVDWFHAVGAVFEDWPEAVVVGNWNEAWNRCRSAAWLRVRDDAWKVFWSELASFNPERANKWEKVTTRIDAVTKELVKRKTSSVVKEHGLPSAFIDHVEQDIHYILMESEHSDIHNGGLYLLYFSNIYHKGHFPCGWIGEPPQGTPIIY